MTFVAMGETVVPTASAEDDDDVVVALETARVSEERGDIEAAVKWLHRAASAARRQGRPNRAGILSRSAAKVGASRKFEKKEEKPQVLADISEDDFAEQTIVETADHISQTGDAAASRNLASTQQSAAAVPATPVVEKPTPLAPLATRPKAAAHQAIRVGVKRQLGGIFEARPLAPSESAAQGEVEAFLVPVEGGKKLT